MSFLVGVFASIRVAQYCIPVVVAAEYPRMLDVTGRGCVTTVINFRA